MRPSEEHVVPQMPPATCSHPRGQIVMAADEQERRHDHRDGKRDDRPRNRVKPVEHLATPLCELATEQPAQPNEDPDGRADGGGSSDDEEDAVHGFGSSE